MARFKRIDVLRTFLETGIVPLFYHSDAAVVKEVILATYKGGARIFEFTNRGDYAHEIFADVNKWAATACPEMILGAGSVVEPGTASLYMQLGANFIVSPSLNSDIAGVCNIRKVAWIPGCATLSEIHTAEKLGCEIVKVFPGKQAGGPDFIKAVLAPSPWSSLMPTGGVSPERENLEQWLNAGACCVGLGSKLIPKEVIEKKDYGLIEKNVRKAISLFQEIKKA